MTGDEFTRREVLEYGAVTGGVLIAGQIIPGSTSHASAQSTDIANPAPAPLDVALRVNGIDHSLSLDPHTTLLDALREHLHLTGSRRAAGLASAAPARC